MSAPVPMSEATAPDVPVNDSTLEGPAGLRRRLVWVVLIGIVAAHSAIDLYLNPFGIGYNPSDVGKFILVGGFMGVILSQPILLGIAAVLWPARVVVRFPITLTILVLWIYATIAGASRLASIDLNFMLAMALEFFIYQVPLRVVRRLRRWRNVPLERSKGALMTGSSVSAGCWWQSVSPAYSWPWAVGYCLPCVGMHRRAIGAKR